MFWLKDLDLSESAGENDDSIFIVFQILALGTSTFLVLAIFLFEDFEIPVYDLENFVEITDEFQ